MMQKMLVVIAMVLISWCTISQSSASDSDLLSQPVNGFELQSQTLTDGLAEIHASRQPSFSVEFPLKKDLGDPPIDDHLISARISGGSLESVLNQLVALDDRFTWANYKHTVNVYLKSAAAAGNNYLMNRKIPKLEFASVTAPSDLVFKTVSLLPGPLEQVAIQGLGPLGSFERPWTATFTNLSLREVYDEIGEHLCDGCGWTLSGANNFRVVRFQARLVPADPRPAQSPAKNPEGDFK